MKDVRAASDASVADASGANLTVEFPAAAVELIARRAAEIVLEQRPAKPASEFLTVNEAAELLRARPQRVYDLLSERRLTRFKDGARVLVSRAEIFAYLGCPPVAQTAGNGLRRRFAA